MLGTRGRHVRRSQLSSDLRPRLRDSGWNNLGRIYENHGRAEGGACLERAVAGNYSGVDASPCSCPISAGGIVCCRGGMWPWMLQAGIRASSSQQTPDARQSSISHLASLAFICIGEKLNREMQIPLNNLAKLMAPVELGLGLMGAQRDKAGWQSLVCGEGAGELGSWTHNHCPGAAAAPSTALSLSPIGRNATFLWKEGLCPLPLQPGPCKEQMEPILNVQSQQKKSQ